MRKYQYMHKFLAALLFFLFFCINVEAKTKNIGDGLKINIPNKYQYFEISLRQLVARFPDLASDISDFEDLGLGLGSKLIVIADNAKTINFFDDVTSATGIEKLNRKHLQPIIKKFTSQQFLESVMRDLQKMYPNKNFNSMSEDEMMELMGEMYADPKMIKKFDKKFKPFVNKFNKEYKFQKYTVIIIGDEPATELLEELNEMEISEMRSNIYDWFDELYEDTKDPSLLQLKEWDFQIEKNRSLIIENWEKHQKIPAPCQGCSFYR